jgi:hypothetical protein
VRVAVCLVRAIAGQRAPQVYGGGRALALWWLKSVKRERDMGRLSPVMLLLALLGQYADGQVAPGELIAVKFCESTLCLKIDF